MSRGPPRPGEAECPGCGRRFDPELHARKGEGAREGPLIRRPSDTMLECLQVLLALGAVNPETAQPMVVLTRRVNVLRLEGRRRRRADNATGGDYSRLLGMGLAGMEYTRVRLEDQETRTWRWETKPRWWITPEGAGVLRQLRPPPPEPGEVFQDPHPEKPEGASS